MSAHPLLAAIWQRIVSAAADPRRELRITCTTRTLADQQEAYRQGRSGLDGVNRWSFHQYSPSLALDFCVVRDGVVTWEWEEYLRVGQIAEAQGLTWGGRWERLRDGPHLELPPPIRIKLLQELLTQQGYSPGAIDGLDGPRTRAAIVEAERDAGLTLHTATADRPRPELWAWLHQGGRHHG